MIHMKLGGNICHGKTGQERRFCGSREKRDILCGRLSRPDGLDKTGREAVHNREWKRVFDTLTKREGNIQRPSNKSWGTAWSPSLVPGKK